MPRYRSDLTTVQDVTRQLEKASQTSTLTSDLTNYLEDAIPAMSHYVARECNRDFVPFQHTLTVFATDDYYQHAWEYEYGHYRFYVNGIPDADLLEIDSIAVNGTTIDSGNYRLAPANEYPARYVTFDDDAFNSVTGLSLPLYRNRYRGLRQAVIADYTDNIAITGTFGFHNDPAQMYTQVEAGITVNDSATTITVADSSVYRVYEYIRIESELLQVTELTDGTTITVLRGVNGSTAAAHTAQAIERVNILDDVRIATTRLVAWAYNNRNDLGTVLNLPDGSVIRNQMPAFVRDTLKKYKRMVL